MQFVMRVAVVVFLTAVVCFFSREVYVSRTFKLTVNLSVLPESVNDVRANGTIELSYNVNRGREISFDGPKAAEKKLNGLVNQEISFEIPDKAIYEFGFSYKPSGRTVLIKNVSAEGKQKIQFNDFSKVKFIGIDKFEAGTGQVKFVSGEPGSGIVFSGIQGLNEKVEYNFIMLIIVISVSFMLFWKIMGYLLRLRSGNKHSLPDIVFVSLFFLLLFVPGVKINDAKESADENRVLAKYIPLMKEHKINLEFGRNFDSWFNDRFFGRYDIISFYEKLICDINFKQENDRAMKGSDGWFFYKSNGSVLNYANLKLFSEPELKLIAEYLSGINDWCEKRNKKFYFLICPDKNKIYGEYYPGYIIKVNSDQKSRSKQLKKYLEANTAVKTVYPYETLIKNKSKGLLYFKGDTHWNSLGAYYAYMDLMDMICVDYEVERFSTGEFELRNSESFDLINMFARSSEEDNMLYKTPILKKNYTLKFVNEKHRGDESSRKEFVLDNNAGSFSVVLFRDSFSTVLLPYLGNTFGKVYSFRGNSIDETVLAGIDNRADIVILEIVERDLVELKNNRFIKK